MQTQQLKFITAYIEYVLSARLLPLIGGRALVWDSRGMFARQISQGIIDRAVAPMQQVSTRI